jgi:hypothetical protein
MQDCLFRELYRFLYFNLKPLSSILAKLTAFSPCVNIVTGVHSFANRDQIVVALVVQLIFFLASSA